MKLKPNLLVLIPIIFFSVSGGPYSLEEIVSSVGPVYTLLFILLLPIVWTIPETMIIAELSSTYPVHGGYYRWVEMGLGRFWGFMEGWWSILYTLIDLSLYPILFIAYLKFLFPSLDFWTTYLIQFSMIWLCAVINILGIRIVGCVLSIFQIVILVLFIFFVILGLNYISFDFSPIFKSSYEFNFKNLLFGLSLSFWNFIGWDNGSTILGEIENPKPVFHKALFITIPIVVISYFFPVLIGLCIHTDWKNWQFGEFSHIAISMKQPLLASSLAIGGMVMCLGMFNSLLLTSTRVFSAMAGDRLMPAVFLKTHLKFHTPYFAIIFLAVVFSLLVLINFQNLLIYDVFLYLISLLLEAFALVALRRRNKTEISNFKVPGGSIGMYFVVCIVALVVLFMIVINFLNFSSSLCKVMISLFFLLSGILVYLWHEKFASY